jgi:hypothetical protein
MDDTRDAMLAFIGLLLALMLFGWLVGLVLYFAALRLIAPEFASRLGIHNPWYWW